MKHEKDVFSASSGTPVEAVQSLRWPVLKSAFRCDEHRVVFLPYTQMLSKIPGGCEWKRSPQRYMFPVPATQQDKAGEPELRVQGQPGQLRIGPGSEVINE